MIVGQLPSRQLISQEDQAISQRADVPRSQFKNRFGRLMTFDAGKLYPFLVDEVLPGDHMSYNAVAYVRMATALFPMMHNQRIDTHFFYVPMRLVWTNSVKMWGEQAEPGDSIAYTVPQVVSPAGGFPSLSLQDYMGLPVVGAGMGAAETITVSALPMRAFNLIYNEWFRDQNLQSRRSVPLTDAADSYLLYSTIPYRNKSHDYFTSALPWPQKFTGPAVPLGGLAPVLGIGAFNQAASTGPVTAYETSGPASYDFYKTLWDNGVNNIVYMEHSAASNGLPLVYANLSAASGLDMNAFRQAYMIQSLMERDARGGSRYVELLRSHFGVTSPDFRLQRPEYIGGGQTQLQLTPVAQTAPTTGAVVGTLGAVGTGVGQHRASYASTEHGYIIGIISVRTELAYQNKIDKMWRRSSRYDFYWPALAGLGEQAILREELHATGNDTTDSQVFGYQERWHEYRTKVSDVVGEFRSGIAGSIDQWHLGQAFGTGAVMSLQASFLYDVPPMIRVLAAGASADGQQYLADIDIERTAVRPIPTYGTPQLLGRF